MTLNSSKSIAVGIARLAKTEQRDLINEGLKESNKF
jgi:hypothetical protein